MKDLIIKYLQNKTSNEENELIYNWINKSDNNKRWFSEQKEIWTLSLLDNQNYLVNIEDQLSLFYKKNDSFSNKMYKRRKSLILYLSSAAVIALLLIVDIFYGSFFRTNNNNIEAANLKIGNLSLYNYSSDLIFENEEIVVFTNKGVKAQTVLPDGTFVMLNSDTKLTYPKVFNDSIRSVKIDGEAHFNVVKDSIRPMLIECSNNFNVRVLGTSLTIKSYKDESDNFAVLHNGRMEVDYIVNNDLKTISMLPNETCFLNENGTIIKRNLLKSADVDIKVSWIKGELNFIDTPMSEVVSTLERWHGSKFIIKDKSIYEFNLTASFESESIVQIMEIIKLCMPVYYDIDKNVVKIYR